jgi:homoserine kinase
MKLPHRSFIARRVVVSVPATCANLGPGFDCLALTLHVRNRFEVILEAPEPPRPPIRIIGAPADIAQLPLTDDNLFLRALRSLCAYCGIPTPPLTVNIWVHLPPGRGLGSSATAVIGGLLAANTLLGDPLSCEELLNLAVACEPGHHADNVAAALLGGLVVTGARRANGRMVAVSLPVPPGLRAVLFIPEMPMSTIQGRSLLPATYTRADVTFNLSRVALLLATLQTGSFDLLATAMEDRLHQPYREQLFPALRALIAAGQAAGAHGACLSGGGSSVLALVSRDAEAVRAALEAAAREHHIAGRSLIADISCEGARATIVNDEHTLTDQKEVSNE